ncbi:MAG: hypothetical protein MJZ24_06170 [Paludibacteraceae bacterium]|nr:hypothetical protein [Paludibacteraceae bacterium]
MDKEGFESYLLKRYNNKNVVANAISRCNRVENSLGIDLDGEYVRDRCGKLIDLLFYTKEDEDLCTPLPRGIIINGNYFNGMASLRNAVRRYVEYCESR